MACGGITSQQSWVKFSEMLFEFLICTNPTPIIHHGSSGEAKNLWRHNYVRHCGEVNVDIINIQRRSCCVTGDVLGSSRTGARRPKCQERNTRADEVSTAARDLAKHSLLYHRSRIQILCRPRQSVTPPCTL